MVERNEQQRDWCYLLPDGQLAPDMKEGCKIMATLKGHSFSSESFRFLVRNGVIKKVTIEGGSRKTRSDAVNTNKLSA